MNERTKTGFEIIQAALLLGILGDAVFRVVPLGLNMFLFVAAISAAMIALTLRRRPEFWNGRAIGQQGALHGALIFFALCFVWRDSAQLMFFDALAILAILAVLTLPAMKIKAPAAGLIHYAVAFCRSGISAAFAPFFLLMEDIKWKTIPQTGWTRHLVAVLRGLAIATPIIGVFLLLFIAADAAFEGLIQRTFNIEGDVLVSHFFVIAFLAWGTAGYLRGSLFAYISQENAPEPETKPADAQPAPPSVTSLNLNELAAPLQKQPAAKKWNFADFDNTALPRFFTLGVTEMSIVMGLINLLFLSFVIVQVPYLFGGFELVQSTENLKLADYARRGFGELVMVAALVLPILLGGQWLLRNENPKAKTVFNILAGIQIALLFVIMFSAAQRLFILTGNLGYGLTAIRLYPMIFMIWLAMLFVWFAMTVMRGRRNQFAWGALWSALFVLGTVHFLNPDDLIARTNIRLMQEGRQYDAAHIRELSHDATPALLEALPTMSAGDRCYTQRELRWRLNEMKEAEDMRTWNWTRWSAKQEMNSYFHDFEFQGCPVESGHQEARPRYDFHD
jgi:hypothetical protein